MTPRERRYTIAISPRHEPLLPNKRMHPTWRGHGLAPDRHSHQLDRQLPVLRRATQVMRGR